MEFAGYRKIFHIISCFWLIGLLALFGCGDSKPDRVEITPAEKTMEVGEDFQFRAAAWSKNKELTGQSFEWQVEGEAGLIDNAGRFTSQKSGQAVILAKAGGVTGRGRVTVKEKQVEESVSKPETAPAKAGISDLQAVIILDSPDFKDRKRGPVTLTHLKHVDEYGLACTECHHDYQDGKNVWEEGDPVKNCVACHDPEETRGEVMKLQNAYHQNCRDCHKRIVEEGKSESAPYRRCTDCHQG